MGQFKCSCAGNSCCEICATLGEVHTSQEKAKKRHQNSGIPRMREELEIAERHAKVLKEAIKLMEGLKR
jgi:hypothetical protein